MSILEFDDRPNLSLESQMILLSLEANAISNLIDTFKTVVPTLTAKIIDLAGFSTEDTTSALIKEMISENKKLDQKLKYVNFVDYKQTLVSVPEGFKGNLLEYLQMLNKLSPAIYKELHVILAEYSSLLAAFITNKDAKISLKDNTGFFARIQTHREVNIKAIDHFFPKDSDTSKTYLSSVISRFNDVDLIVTEAARVDKHHVAQNMKEAKNAIDKCVDLLNVVIRDMNSGAINNVSGAASEGVAKGAYEVAKYIEFVSVYRYKVEQAVSSAQKLVEQLNRIIN